MKVIIAGGREVKTDCSCTHTHGAEHRQHVAEVAYRLVSFAMESFGFHGPQPSFRDVDNSTCSEVVCGGARGIDEAGKDWATVQWIPFKVFHAEWDEFGKAAGPIRNRQMAEYADILVAIWDGKSRGTKNMIYEMTRLNKPVHVYRTDKSDA